MERRQLFAVLAFLGAIPVLFYDTGHARHGPDPQNALVAQKMRGHMAEKKRRAAVRALAQSSLC